MESARLASSLKFVFATAFCISATARQHRRKLDGRAQFGKPIQLARRLLKGS